MIGKEMMRYVLPLMLLAAPAFAGEEVLQMRGTDFVGATAFTRAIPGRPASKVFLTFYRSPLGEEFHQRPPSTIEVDEMRRLCAYMQAEAKASATGAMDEYMIEFATGKGAPDEIAPEMRTVFGFTEKRGCDADPAPIQLN
jgi:hypothetical protein